VGGLAHDQDRSQAEPRQTEAVKEIDSIFPEGLRSRVLEFVQFRNTARMDDLGKLIMTTLWLA
jgi:hypothetical protein